MAQLTSVRTNMSFEVDYKTNLLVPTVEIILLVTKPIYKRGKDNITRVEDVQEFRLKTNLSGVNVLIGELQTTVTMLSSFDQLGASINAVIKGKQEFDNNKNK